MTATAELYDLLPKLYRARDVEHGHALEALLEILGREADLVERDIEQLYENWFVETCDPWVVPYIGELLGVRRLYPVGPGTGSMRGYVANTLAYRRRKGTLAVLEQLAYDVTGWRAKAVEFFQLLGTTQYAKHVRAHNVRTPDLRDVNALELVGGPFERAAHTADVRRIVSGRGRYNLPNVGLFVWRLTGYPLDRVTARRAEAPVEGGFRFSPVGLDMQLFNRSRTEASLVDLARELDVPGPLRRRALRDELEGARQASVDLATPRLAYFDEPPVLEVFVRAAANESFELVPAAEILVVDLSLWQRPPQSKSYTPSGEDSAQPQEIGVAVDPVLGRLTFPAGNDPDAVEVGFAYGFSGDLGGGPYDRSEDRDGDFMADVKWQRGVGGAEDPEPDEVVATLTEAIEAWNLTPAGTAGVIAVLDSRTYEETLPTIELKPGSKLMVVAAGWPGPTPRQVGTWVPAGRRPHLRGDLIAVAAADAGDMTPGQLSIEGLLVEGRIQILAGDLALLRLADCTVLPAAAALVVESSGTPEGDNGALEVELERTICGGIELADEVPELRVRNSIVHAEAAIAATGAAATIERSTVLGSTAVRTLHAENSIFTGGVTAVRRQVGCIRFCYVPREPPPSAPRRYRCQPDLALRDVAPGDEELVAGRLVPTFTSTDYGHPGYGQLGVRCAIELRTGADDGSELGVFTSLRQPHREANLRAALDEYLRLGLEAGIVPVT